MFKKIKENYNPSTLSGSLDIIVIEHEDGTLRSSPWHLRFGKLGLLHHTQKVISVTINDIEAPFSMYVDQSGKGQFFESQTINSTNFENVSYPSLNVSNINISAKDVRNLLNSKKKTFNKIKSSKIGKFILRDNAVDFEAPLEFEDPDPIPFSTESSSLDLAQSINTTSKNEGDLVFGNSEESPTPSAILLQSIRSYLNFGKNIITFTVSSLIQGPKTITSNLYLWNTNIKIVISDVDGTVTSSDLLGHVLPTIGRDWTHPGLANLYTLISNLNFQFLYLSSRPIGEAPLTRKTLLKINQNGFILPDGPLITAPDRMIPAITREVVLRKPHEFKIPTLKTILSLFPNNSNPFIFGFGNRKTDVLSYQEVGLLPKQILLFDTHHQVLDSNGNILYSSINLLSNEINKFF